MKTKIEKAKKLTELEINVGCLSVGSRVEPKPNNYNLKTTSISK